MQNQVPVRKGEFVILFTDVECILEKKSLFNAFAVRQNCARVEVGGIGERTVEREDEALADLAMCRSLTGPVISSSSVLLKHCGFLVCKCKSQATALGMPTS